MSTPHSLPQDTAIHLSTRLARMEDEFDREFERIMGVPTDPPTTAPKSAEKASRPILKPLCGHDSRNTLRPSTLAEVVGQEPLKPLLRQLINTARAEHRPLHHILFVGAGGTGKTTMATVIANEIGTRVFVLEAPLDMGILEELAEVARDRDVIFVDEIHKQVAGDRRGRTEASDKEMFYMVLEDGMIASSTGPKPFPHVTWIGATTDVGLLPVSLSDRFTIQPQLAPYTLAEMTEIARRNARGLNLITENGVCEMAAGASRNVPRLVNNYMRAAADLGGSHVSLATMEQVITVLNSTTLDGLTGSMQTVLTYLYRFGAQESQEGLVYRASVNDLSNAAGHGQDTKAIYKIETYLIQCGYLQKRTRGRQLTPAGADRARQLLGGQ